MTTDRTLKILLEVANGVPAPANEDDESKRIRAQLKREVDEIRARGDIIDIPSEIP